MNGMFSNDDALVRRLQQLADGAGSGTGSWQPAGGRSIDGRVVLDSRDGAMEAVRSTASLAHRQLIVEAGDLLIALDVTNADGDDRARDHLGEFDHPLVVRGQILAGLSGAAVVQFVDLDGVEGALATVDDLGEFEVWIEAGDWMLFVADDDNDAVASVTLG